MGEPRKDPILRLEGRYISVRYRDMAIPEAMEAEEIFEAIRGCDCDNLVPAAPASSEEGADAKRIHKRVADAIANETVVTLNPWTLRDYLAALRTGGTPEADALEKVWLDVLDSVGELMGESDDYWPVKEEIDKAFQRALSRTPATQNQGEDDV